MIFLKYILKSYYKVIFLDDFKFLPNGKEDYDCWKRLLEHTNCYYLSDKPYFYYASFPDHDGKYNYN
jgi:hypothetical protein